MSYSDRKEGNWDYQRVSGQLKAQEKAQKEAIKAAEKAAKKAAKSSRRSSYNSAPKNLTVDQVMADYNSWNAKQPQTAEQVMADFNAWNTDSDAWMKSQAPVQTVVQTTAKKKSKNEVKQEEQKPVKQEATRIHFDPTKQERPDPSAITKGKKIPQLEITDPSSAYNNVVDYKEELRKIDKEKERQQELREKNKAIRLEKQAERAERAKARKDWTTSVVPELKKDYGTGIMGIGREYADQVNKLQKSAYGDMTDRELAELKKEYDSNTRFGLKTNEQRLLDREIDQRKKAKKEEKYGTGLKAIWNESLDNAEKNYAKRVEDYQKAVREYQKVSTLTDPSAMYRETPEQRAARNDAMLNLYAAANGYSLEGAKEDLQEQNDKALVQQWLDPSYKMSDEERTRARQIIEQYWDDPEWNQDDLSKLSAKENAFVSGATAFAKPIYNAAHFVGNVVDDVVGTGLEMGAELVDAIPGIDGAAQAVRDARADYQNMTGGWANQMDTAAENASTQHPIASGVGNFAGQAAMYALTNPAFDAIAGVGNLGLAGTAALEQAGQNLQDLLLDTLPEYEKNIRNGMSQEDAIRQAFETQGYNALGNLAIPIIGDLLSGGKKAITNYFKNANTPDPEFLSELRKYRQNVLDPLAADADNIAKAARTTDLSPLETAAKNVDVDNVATAGRQTVNNLDELAEQATKQAPIEQVKPIAPEASTAEEVIEQAAKTDVAPNGLRYPEQDNPIIDSIETARKGMEEGIPKATSQLDTQQAQVDNVLSKYDFSANEETKVLLDAVQDDYKTYRKVIQVGDTEAADATAKKLRSDLGKLHRRAEKYVPDYKGELNIRDITQGSNYPAYSIRNMKNAKIDADSVMNNWNNSFLASEFGEMTREQYDTFLKEAQDLGWVDELGNPTKEALGSIPSSEYDDILSQYDDIVKNALEQGNTERDTAASILDSLEQEQKAGRVYLDDKEWYDMVGAANNYARTGEKQYLEQMNDIVSAKRAAEAPVDIAPVKAEPVNNAPVQVEQIAPQKAVPVDEGRGPLRERNFAKDVRDYRVEGLPNEVVEDFEKNRRVYKQLKNADTASKADASIAKGFDEAMQDFNTMLDRMDPAAVPLGQKLAQQLSEQGDYAGAADIADRVAEGLTKSGQFSQAAVIALMKDDPMAALHYIRRQINKLNAEGARKWGKKWTDFDLTKDEMDMFSKIAPGDKEAIKNAYDMIGERFGAAYPTSMLDKMLEARRIGMLLNSGTLVRNVLANIPTLGMRWTADRFDAIGQNIVHIIDPSFEVTNSIKGSGISGRKLAKEFLDSDAGKKLFEEANVSKYMDELNNEIMKNKTVFKGTKFEHWIDDFTGGGFQKLNKKFFGKSNVRSIPESFRNLTYKLLEAGDTPFVKENFKQRLGSYINAQHIKSIKDIPQEAIDFAWEEAMKATYKDNSWAVQAISGLRKGIGKIPVVGKPLAEGTIPFVQAPGNIAARMVDYSPIRGSKGVYDVVRGAITKDHDTIRKGIEEMSKGLTGAGLVYLGMKLREAGVITGAFSTDKDEKAFQKQTGFQEFSIHAGDKYVSYDWAQPFAEALLVGTLLQDAIENSDKYDSEILRHFGYEGTTAGKLIGGAVEGAKQSVDSWFNASPLKGLRDLFGKNGYGEADGDFSENVLSLLGGFAESFIPASLNATAKSIDTVQRNTYDPQNEFTSRMNAIQAKIPELSKELPAKYDTWGRKMTYADNSAEAAFTKFINPSKVSEEKMTDIDTEIERIYSETKDRSVFPDVAPKTVGTYTLNNYEMSEYQKDMGRRSYKFAESFMDSDLYDYQEDDERADTLGTLYGISKAITERDLFDKEIPDKYGKYVEAYEDYGMDGLMAYMQVKYDLDGKNTNYAKLRALDDLDEDMQEDILPMFIELEKDDGSPNTNGEFIENYGADGLIEFYKNGYKATGRKVLPETKSEAMEAAEMYPESMQREMYDEYVSRIHYSQTAKTTKAEEAAYEEGGLQGLNDFLEKEDLMKEYGYSYDEPAQKIYKEGGIPALEEYGQTLQELAPYNLDKSGVYSIYQNAKNAVPSLTVDDFAEDFTYLDSFGNSDGKGKNNQSISQDEIIAAMNADPQNAKRYQDMFWASDSYVPVLQNGKYVKKSTGKKKKKNK